MRKRYRGLTGSEWVSAERRDVGLGRKRTTTSQGDQDTRGGGMEASEMREFATGDLSIANDRIGG